MISNQPLVSIITPVFNGARFIEELILSVKEQDYPHIEHIIIDDGSNDNGATVAILKKYPHLRWWGRENRGQYATMNEGLNAAKGEVVCFISADDVLVNGAIREAVESIFACPDCDGVYGFTAFIREDSKPYLPVVPFRKFPIKYYPYFWQVSHCSLYVKKNKLIDSKLYFDQSLVFVGDYDWIIRLVSNGVDIKLLPKVLSRVRIHETQSSVLQRKKMRLEQDAVAKKYGLNSFLFSFSMLLTTWLFNVYKLFFTVKQKGLKGSVKLIQNWLRRRSYPVS